MDQYVVMEFEKGGDENFVAKYSINRLTLTQLQNLFGIDEQNPMCDCYLVTELQRAAIEDDIGIKLNTSMFEYLLSCE